MAAGLGAFLQGFVGGYDTRQRWKDAKRQRSLDEEDRAYTLEQRAKAEEDRQFELQRRGWAVDDREFEVKERERIAAEEAAERAAAADAYETAKEGDKPAPKPRSLTDTGAATGETGLSFGAGIPAMSDPALSQQGRSLPAQPPMAAQPGMMGRGLPTVLDAQGQNVLPYFPQGKVPTLTDWQKMTPAQRAAAGLPVDDADLSRQLAEMDSLPGAGTPQRRTLNSPQTERSGFVGEQPPPTIAAWNDMTPEGRAAQPPEDFSGAVNAEVQGRSAAVIPPPVAPETAANVMVAGKAGLPPPVAPGAAPEAPAADRQFQPPAPPAAPVSPPPDPLKASASAPRTAALAPSEQAVAVSPAVQEAVATAPAPAQEAGKPRLAFSINNPVKVSPAKRDAAVSSFMTRYMEVGAPKMLDYYLSTGQVEKADAYQKWISDTKSQETLRLYAEGVHAAAIGDTEGMLDSFSLYYNSFNDGITVVREKSGFNRDASGNITGVKLTFVNDETGEEWVQDLGGAEELLQQGVYALPPEKMIERMFDQEQAANAVEAATQKLLIEKAGEGGFKSMPQRVAAAMAELSKNVIGFDKLPPEEQQRMVVERIANEDAALAGVMGGGAAGEVPVARRPAP